MPLFSYIDENEQLRGPFEGVQMHYWYLKGYLPSTLHIFVHYGLYGRSTTLEELRERNGDLNPFFEVVTLRRGNPSEPLSSNSGSHSSLLYGLENVRKTRELSAKEPMNECNRNYEAGASKVDYGKQFYCDLCDVTMPRTLMFEHCTTKAHSGKCVVEALDVLEEMRLYNESDEGGATEATSNRLCTKSAKLSRDHLSSMNGRDRAFSWSMDDGIFEEFSEKRKSMQRRLSLSKTGKERYYDYRKECALM
ncbi:unnamed protein product [Cylicocyclus nassatus]|uniref:GYF domain-containing protein n=1 Tax=Cylicocyclus nassatus TaxID=53992 RepID=A0AA36H047_CYLNA|nr:unnamed protein product [Cylicocyclus nassatus]